MAYKQVTELLTDALSYIDGPCFHRLLRIGRDRAALAARLEEQIAELALAGQAVAEAHARWSLSSFIRVDPDGDDFEEADGCFWVRGWIKIGSGNAHDAKPNLRERYERAVDNLSLFTREVFNAHRLNGLHYDAIAVQYGISPGEVEQIIGDALSKISKAFTAD